MPRAGPSAANGTRGGSTTWYSTCSVPDLALERQLGLLAPGEQLAVLDPEHVVVAREPGELHLDRAGSGRRVAPGDPAASARLCDLLANRGVRIGLRQLN